MHYIVNEWDIPMSKIFCVITDNGSNMIAAFKQHSIKELSTTDSDSIEIRIKKISFNKDNVNSTGIKDSTVTSPSQINPAEKEIDEYDHLEEKTWQPSLNERVLVPITHCN
uniref:DUF659 domain-containing protein n=1 Tax=Amphimedon queenslandica TaxID=400682 RepID=A0A1X7TYW2_AMPQE